MSKTLMFMPLSPKTGRRAPGTVDEFHEQLTRHGIEMPELEEGSNFYSLQLPKVGNYGGIEEEVMFLVEDEVVLGVSIESAQTGGQALWLQLIQMGYVMQVAGAEVAFVSQEWATQYQTAGIKIANIQRIEIVSRANDLPSI